MNLTVYFKTNPRSWIVGALKETEADIMDISSTPSGEWRVKLWAHGIDDEKKVKQILSHNGGT